MTKNLFVGGLPYETKAEELTRLFSACGKVAGVKLIMDGLSGRCKGFGFVEMSTEAEAQDALARLNGTLLGERKLVVSEARPLERRPGVPPGKPGFVERRSGVKDRRRQPSEAAPAKRAADKPWPEGAKREGFGGKKRPWDKPAGHARKPKDFGGRKKWGGKRARPGPRDQRRFS